MIKPVSIRDMTIGEGIPKICVPIVGKTAKEIKIQAQQITDLPIDFVEWRADWYEAVEKQESVIEQLSQIRKLVKNLPILFTIRTKKEGGESELTLESYQNLNLAAAESGFADLIDIEAFFNIPKDENFLLQRDIKTEFMPEQTKLKEDPIKIKLIAAEQTELKADPIKSIAAEQTELEVKQTKQMIKQIQKTGVKVIVSSHEFYNTPEKEQMIQRLCFMQKLGGDIVKLAVMPKNPEDVLKLLETTWKMVQYYAEQPIITMAMSGQGLISRLSGEIFGSAVTFGSMKTASAPGQIPVKQLRGVLELIHENK